MEANNSDFWDIAYRVNAPALLGVLRRYVKNAGIAQDLLHEVFITAIDKYDGYAGKGSFEGWLYRITVNTALMYLRDERHNFVETGHALSLLTVVDDNADDIQEDGARATIEAAGFSSEELLFAIDRLPEHHKLVFNMYVLDDFSHKQIAAELHISPGTSKSHLARARKKVQQILFEDAMDRKKKKDRRWASAFLLIFPAREHYIDRLFRKGLSDFSIPPTGGTEFMSAAIEQQAASVTSITSATVQSAAFWGSKLSYMAACCGTAAITGTICWLSMSVNSPMNRNNDVIYNEITVIESGIDDVVSDLDGVSSSSDEVTSVSDDGSLSTESSKEKIAKVQNNPQKNKPSESSNTALPSETPSAPVVVKKQIIQHQTVVLHDTIFIIE